VIGGDAPAHNMASHNTASLFMDMERTIPAKFRKAARAGPLLKITSR
jgi:hypothetical protein